jgi:hypothetical protein
MAKKTLLLPVAYLRQAIPFFPEDEELVSEKGLRYTT